MSTGRSPGPLCSLVIIPILSAGAALPPHSIYTPPLRLNVIGQKTLCNISFPHVTELEMPSVVVRKREDWKRKKLCSFLHHCAAGCQQTGGEQLISQGPTEGQGQGMAGREPSSVIAPRGGSDNCQLWGNPGKASHAAFIRDFGAASGQMFTFKLN